VEALGVLCVLPDELLVDLDAESGTGEDLDKALFNVEDFRVLEVREKVVWGSERTGGREFSD
jgi:hypothetical protein